MDQSDFRTVDWVADADELNRARLKRSSNRLSWEYFSVSAYSWLIHALSGIAIGAIALMLTLSTGWLADLREGHCSTSWYLNEATCCLHQPEGSCVGWVPHPWYASWLIYVSISVIFAAVSSLLVVSLAPLAAGSGIGEIKCIINGFFAVPFLSLKVLVVKCIALPLSIAAGLSVGKEGPSIHYSACVGQLVASRFGRQDYRKRMDIITACCAAGVAVAFGSPIGGVLFALEEMASEVSLNTIWRSYFCCFVATSVVSIFNPFRTGQVVLFSVRYDTTWHAFDLPFFVLLGVFGGLVGRFIIKTNLRITALRKKFWGPKNPIVEAGVLALVTAALCFFNPYLKVDMTRSMQILFHECDHGGEFHPSCDPSTKGTTMLSLAFAFATRLILLLVTYGAAKVPAGIFVPSLAIGALFGRFVGTFVWLLNDNHPTAWFFSACQADEGEICVNPGAYALLGAGALLSGVMHISLSVVVIMFELTGALHYVMPTMIVVGVTKLIYSQMPGGPIADMSIRQNGYPYLEREPHEGVDFKGMTAASVMVPAADCAVVHMGGAVPRDSQNYRTFPIVDSNNRLVGATSGSKVDNSPLTVLPTDSLEDVYTLFAKLGPHTIYVVEKGEFKGLITRKMISTEDSEEGTVFSPTELRAGAVLQHFFDTLSAKLELVRKVVRRSHA